MVGLKMRNNVSVKMNGTRKNSAVRSKFLPPKIPKLMTTLPILIINDIDISLIVINLIFNVDLDIKSFFSDLYFL
jgi:hypothetical protein